MKKLPPKVKRATLVENPHNTSIHTPAWRKDKIYNYSFRGGILLRPGLGWTKLGRLTKGTQHGIKRTFIAKLINMRIKMSIRRVIYQAGSGNLSRGVIKGPTKLQEINQEGIREIYQQRASH